MRTYKFNPASIGIELARLEDLKGGTAEENAVILRAILSGEKGPKRDVVLLNAAAAFIASDKASDFREGVKKAEESIDSGAALEKLDRLIEYTQG
ncbi:MAG: hypothetical protein HY776_07010 [Actinobacteria bacterium]|nr:hypothetical protein [Actinomycetota bacterium]